MDLGTQIPHSKIAEMAIIGSMMYEPSIIKSYLETQLPIEIFYDEDNKKVLNIMLDVYNRSGVVDSNLVLEEINKMNLGDRPKDGSDYLHELLNQATVPSAIPHYLKIVEDKYKLRMIIDKSREIIQKAQNEVSDIDDFLFESEETILGLTRNTSQNSMKDSEQIVKEAREKFEQAMSNDGSVTGLDTGYNDLNKVTSGLQKGDLIILGARPSVGKTAFALNLGLNVARMNKEGKSVVAFFSLEMPAFQLTNRLTSTLSNVPNYKIRDGRVNDKELNNINGAYSTIQQMNLFINDDGGITVPDIFKECRSLKKDHGLDIVIIDYMQLINSKTAGANRQAEISAISRQMKQLARELDVPVIALSQLSRKLEQREDKTPILSDLRESGSIEQDADIVLFLHRDDYGDVKDDGSIDTGISETLLRVAKNRNGGLKDINIVFEKHTGKFVDVIYNG